MGIEPYSGQEYLFYVGDVGSFEERAKKVARSVASILIKSKIEFGILGEREMSDGNEVNRVGERGLYEYMAKANIELFREIGVTKIITLSPHAYHAFKNDYPRFGAAFEVKHYSQVLSNLVRDGRLASTGTERQKATFHDPCFLGRHNREYEAPREVLKAVPGLDLVEMERSGEDALCCGGGGGNFFTDLLGAGPQSPSRIRVREAVETGAEILVTTCPKCFNMLDDAVKAEGLEEMIFVRDLSQLF
jgi:Fe-S oxidoreductase